MTLPKAYTWLANEPGPRILVEALKTYGVQEAKGSANNPTILWWAKSIGLKNSYKNDSIPWCGLTVAYWCAQSGYPFSPNGNPLWARNWLNWEVESNEPMLGDILVFKRGSSGHVGIYVGETETDYLVLGGNQGDMVNIKPKAKKLLLGARRRKWVINQPASVRKIQISASGVVLPASDRED